MRLLAESLNHGVDKRQDPSDLIYFRQRFHAQNTARMVLALIAGAFVSAFSNRSRFRVNLLEPVCSSNLRRNEVHLVSDSRIA
jgi:hypothetical protein